MRRTGPDQRTAQLVTARNLGMCLRCNRRPGSQIHHRTPRGMGGTRDPMINNPANLAWVCLVCHSAIESRRADAFRDGWLVRRGADPSAQPLITTTESMIMLDRDGGMITNSLAGINEGPTPW